MNARWFVVLLGVALGSACVSGPATAPRPGSSALEWPPGDPRVRFERAFRTKQDLGRSAFFRRLAGQGPEALFQRPFGVAWEGDDLLVTDPGAGVVLKLTEKGKVVRSRPGVMLGPMGVAACRMGIVVSDSRGGGVGLFDERLRLIRWLAEDLDRPTGVTCSANGVAVVETGAHRIVVLGDDGGRRVIGERGTGPAEFNFPAAITADGATIWVGDTLNFRVQGIDVSTGQSKVIFGGLGDSPGETPRIKGLAVDTQGHLWVSDAHLDLLSLFDRQGVFLTEIGGRGDAKGEFSFPAGISAHPDGRVAVVDSLNRRIQVFRVLKRPAIGTDEGR